jgi:hypothetical protein
MDMRSRRAGALWALLLIAGSSAEARAETDNDRDVRQTVRARQILRLDPALAPYNIGVIVHNRVATLWGPIPTPGLSLRAERTLRNLFELADVRNELEIGGELEPGTEATPALPAPSFLPAKLPPALPQSAPPPAAPRAPAAMANPKPAQPQPAPPPPTTEPPLAPPPASTPGDLELPPIAVPRFENLPARLPQGPE